MKKATHTIGKYVIERELGSGTMGTVYLGYDSKLEQRRAIKVMRTGVEEKSLRDRFFFEGRSAAKLDHPNIIRIYDLDTDANSRPYIVMEYIEGEDLKTFIDQKLFLPFTQKLKIVIDVCAGLDHAHEKGIIHRDIKPGNIRISRNGEAKILDFGLARLESAALSRTGGGVIGSPYYMSPEQWRGVRDLDRRSDLFSVAAVLYELITYVRPFEADAISAVMTRIVSEPHTPLRDSLPACAPELSGILDRGLAKNRDHRFPSCIEFSRALVAFQAELPANRAEVQKELERIKDESERCKQRSAELYSLQFLDSSLFEDDEAGENAKFFHAVSTDEISDYGVMLQRHAYLQERLAFLNEKLHAAQPLLRLLRAAQLQFQDGQLEACQQTLEELLNASPANPSGVRLLEACQRKLEERRLKEEHQARLLVPLSQARKALEEGDFKKALQSVGKVLEIEPFHREAIELRDAIRLQQELSIKGTNRRAAELLRVCRDHFRAGKYDSALAASEELLKFLSIPGEARTNSQVANMPEHKPGRQ